jgi:hypothetical protein
MSKSGVVKKSTLFQALAIADDSTLSSSHAITLFDEKSHGQMIRESHVLFTVLTSLCR